MTPHPRLSWPAAEPPADFAERTVAAMLRRPVGWQRLRRRAFLASAIAAVMIAGGAWGLARSARHQISPPATTIAQAPPVRDVTPPATAVVVDPSAPTPSTAVRRRKSEAHAPPTSSLPSAARKIIVPRCNCSPSEATICDCF